MVLHLADPLCYIQYVRHIPVGKYNICCILKMVFVCIFLDIINIYTALLIDAPAAQSHVFWPLCCLMLLCRHIKVLIFRALSWHSTSHDLPL